MPQFTSSDGNARGRRTDLVAALEIYNQGLEAPLIKMKCLAQAGCGATCLQRSSTWEARGPRGAWPSQSEAFSQTATEVSLRI